MLKKDMIAIKALGLKDVRQRAGVTVNLLSEITGITTARLYALEAITASLRTGEIALISKALNCTIGDILKPVEDLKPAKVDQIENVRRMLDMSLDDYAAVTGIRPDRIKKIEDGMTMTQEERFGILYFLQSPEVLGRFEVGFLVSIKSK